MILRIALPPGLRWLHLHPAPAPYLDYLRPGWFLRFAVFFAVLRFSYLCGFVQFWFFAAANMPLIRAPVGSSTPTL